jgi:SAM-dependent methyltransferase
VIPIFFLKFEIRIRIYIGTNLQLLAMSLKSFIDRIHDLHLEERDGVAIEVEVKVLLDANKKLPPFVSVNYTTDETLMHIRNILIKAKSLGAASLSETINFIDTQPNIMHVKQLCYENGVQNKEKKNYYSKSSCMRPLYLVSPINMPHYKLSVNKESVMLKSNENFDIVRFRLRYSVDVTDTWRMDFTIVKECCGVSIESLKDIRNQLFPPGLTAENFIDTVDWNSGNKMELEMEYIGDIKNFNVNDVLTIDTFMPQLDNVSTNHEEEYKIAICSIAKILRPDILHKFTQGQFGLKQLGSKPIELTKKMYTDEISPNIDNFIITPKVDGMYTMIMIDNGKVHILNTNHSYLEGSYKEKNITIFDAEYVDINGKPCYYILDVILYNNEPINTYELPFQDRVKYIDMISNMDARFIKKPFVRLTQQNYAKEIRDMYNSLDSHEYGTDGIIMISCNKPYQTTLNLKWKTMKHMTVDFIARECPKQLLGITPYINQPGKTLYLLFSGIRLTDFKKMRLTLIKHYSKIFLNIQRHDEYFPIQFSPSSNPFAYLFWAQESNLDNKVVELTWNRKWELIRIRDDRASDVARKTYYGNYFKIAEHIWMNYFNPLLIEHMCNPVCKSYFQQANNKSYVASRKFNNFVKKELIDMYSDTKWVIDLASGKGQDLFKYLDCNIPNILMIEQDYDAIFEIINRKYTFVDDSRYKNASNILIHQADLCDDSVSNIDRIKSTFHLPDGGVNLIVCNLAMHYLIGNREGIINFVNMLDAFLAPGGVFIFTAFAGQNIFDLIGEKSEWNSYIDESKQELKYSIKKLYKSTTFTGSNQKIDVLLPFSNGTYYPENLINISNFKQECKKKRITMLASNSFQSYLDKFKTEKPQFYKQMDSSDVKYVSLYNYYIFHKAVDKKTNKLNKKR